MPVQGKGGSVASQRKHKTVANKHESDGHLYSSGISRSAERFCGPTLPAVSTAWQETCLSLPRLPVFVLGMPLKVLKKFCCSFHA